MTMTCSLCPDEFNAEDAAHHYRVLHPAAEFDLDLIEVTL